MGPVGPNPDRQERSYESYDLPEDVQRPDLNLDFGIEIGISVQ